MLQGVRRAGSLGAALMDGSVPGRVQGLGCEAKLLWCGSWERAEVAGHTAHEGRLQIAESSPLLLAENLLVVRDLTPSVEN